MLTTFIWDFFWCELEVDLKTMDSGTYLGIFHLCVCNHVSLRRMSVLVGEKAYRAVSAFLGGFPNLKANSNV